MKVPLTEPTYTQLPLLRKKNCKKSCIMKFHGNWTNNLVVAAR